jgi:hypothetical protein
MMISDKDKKEILDQYRAGYAYDKKQIIRWYGATNAEAEEIMKQGRRLKNTQFNRGQ